ncbi:MAG TPA: hypothetical protein VFA17_02255 [Thermoplasmata archaeon]|jgi:hypothetical protein|nr:hypothetical protein [Thermoplasmata archaeon]
MVEKAAVGRYRHGLSFLGTVAFVGGFFGARLFHLLLPSVMIITGGIHFHHFWYGLIMVGVAGWIGIAYDDVRVDRACAVVFGLGLGFVGDEVGLLLTFGDYYSELTLDFFVAAIAAVILATLLIRHWNSIEAEVTRLKLQEKLTHIGIFVGAFSTVFFAFDAPYLGLPLLALSAGLFFLAFVRRQLPAGRERGEP